MIFGCWRLTRQLARHSDDVVERIAVAIHVEQRAETAETTRRRCLLTATKRSTQNIAEDTTQTTAAVLTAAKHITKDAAKAATLLATTLLRHITGNQHSEDW